VQRQVISRRGAVVAAGLVVAWRILAYLAPSTLIEQPSHLALPLAAVGLVFVAAGLTVYLGPPRRAAGPYLAWCLSSGLHWGGAVGAGSAGVERSLLLLYIGVTVAGQAALLHLALSYPSVWKTPRWLRALLYVPGAMGVVAAPPAGILETGALSVLVGILLLCGSALGLGAGAVFVVRLLGTDRSSRRDSRLGIAVTCLVVSAVPSLLAGSGLLPGESENYNLLFALAPIGLGYALRHGPGTRSSGANALPPSGSE
jgi:hypothetical protein